MFKPACSRSIPGKGIVVPLAVVVLAGRYTGYRLLELSRFKVLTGN